VSLLELALQRFDPSGYSHQYLLLLEDDFPLCQNALQTLLYAIDKVCGY
jgi:hypothetical protein